MKNFKLINKKKNIYLPIKKKIIIGKSMNNFLIKQAKINNHQKAMILIHKNKNNKFQEMLMCLTKKKRYDPHINLKSEKSYHIIYGKMKIIFFLKNGKIKESHIIEASKNYYFRFNKKLIHTVEILSNYAIFYERVLGPHKLTKYYNF